MRLVLDTNVVISGLLWHGPAARLIDLLMEQFVVACVNPFLAKELSEKLAMSKFAARIGAAGLTPHRLCSQYLAVCEPVPATTVPRTCRDADDDHVLAAAIAGRADLIVSGEKDLRTISTFEGIPIVDAPEALLRFGVHDR